MMRDGMLASWSFDPWLALWLALPAVLFLRGSMGWRGRSAARLACFLGGLAAIWLALASPIEAFAPLLLSAHMTQHMLLTMVAAPLLLLGEPFVPILRGVPAGVRRHWVRPFLASRSLRRALRRLAHPVVAWIVFAILLIAWHLPALYELALREPAWHRVEHLSLLGGAVLFWWPVIQPRPSRPWWPRWAMVPYLLAADLVNTVIAATFAFAPSVIYPTYAATAPALGADPLRDQAAAGAIMWVPGSVAYLVPATVILVGAMRPRSWRTPAAHRAPVGPRRAAPAPLARDLSLPQLAPRRPSAGRFDLLRVPLLGPLLRRRGVRLGVRVAMFVLAAAIVVDGFVGPREAPMNLAGTLPWTHWRGAAVILLLVGGNVLCMACPFVLPRMAADRWRRARSGRDGAAHSASGRAGRRWPRLLRNKWSAAALVATWLVAYESFDLWAIPAATAAVIVAYFVAAFVTDSLASGGAFCKWLCPLGQFNFAQSTLSPLTVAARDPAICASCTTHDCLRGNERQRGCGLELFLPRKTGNLDCTFCLDCADACPHGNVGIVPVSIGDELRSDRWRSSLGTISRRPDLATLLLVLAVGAVVNAAGMTSPLLELIASIADSASIPRGLSAMLVVTGMIAGGVALALLAALAARGRRWLEGFTALGLSSAPLGASVWLVHFAFHFVTSWSTAGPVIVRAAGDLGWTAREPQWSSACCSAAPEWLLPANLLALSLGLSLSLQTLRRRETRWWPGALVLAGLWSAAAWVLFQPMDMRGTLGFGVSP